LTEKLFFCQTLVRTIDGAHEHLARALGTALFGTGLFAFQAVGFADDKDKEAHFIQRLVVSLEKNGILLGLIEEYSIDQR
jgi:hypothetical protein